MILDEPTTGLDPQARHLVWERLFQLKQRGVSILLTTHYMDEAEQLCDRLVVMDEGRIIASGSPRELIDTHVTKEVVELRFGAAHTTELAELALTLNGVGAQIEALPDKILVYTDDADDTNAALEARDVPHLDPGPPRLPRRRLPASHRPCPRGGRSVTAVLIDRDAPTPAQAAWRAFNLQLALFRHVWHGTVFTSVLLPILYMVSIGIGVAPTSTRPPSAASTTPSSSPPASSARSRS